MPSVKATEILRELYDDDTKKFFDEPATMPLFDAPLVGVAAADDPWFARFKQILGPWYWTPQEALELAAPGATARSVICFCLPVAEIARKTNRREREMPSRAWAYVRTYGEEFVTRMRLGLVERLQTLGQAAVAPAVAPQHKVERRPGVGLSDCWSERHMAFVAGLGTFGISGGLITSRGVAHRLGSVVTDTALEPTPRPYGDDPFAWCLKLSRDTCGACIKRCPVAAIGPSIHDRDKEACFKHAYEYISERGRTVFGWEGVYGCGLCQTGVPCESRNPTAEK
jgi:epoxyqueuosine reductase QueG